MLTTIHGAKDHRIYHKEAISLSKDHEVTVIALGDSNKTTEENGITIKEFKGILTPLNHLLNCTRAFSTALKTDTDVYHCHEPSSLFLGCLLKILKNSKLIYDRHDYYPQLVKEKFDKMGLCKISPLIKSIESLSEAAMIKLFVDKTIVADVEMGGSFVGSVPIHNYPKGLTGKVRSGKSFSYVGILDHRKIPESISIFNELIERDDNIKYSIAGNAFDKSLIPKNEQNIAYHGVIPHEKINEFLNETSFGICFYNKLPRYENAVSTKTYEYIASGIPVIASRTEGNQFIEENGLGILIEPDILFESIAAIEKAIPKCSEFSKNCLKMNYVWEEEKLLNVYRGLK